MLSTVKVLLIVSALVCSTLSVPSLKCLSYLIELNGLYDINKGLFLKEMAPYMLFSGKQANDLGFPKMCNDNKMGYTTVKFDTYVTDQHVSEHPDFLFSFYYGFCFTDVCTVSDLNEGGSNQMYYSEFVIEKLFEEMPVKVESITFYDAQLESQVSAGAVIFIIIISVWILLGMVGLFSKWLTQCQSKQNIEIEISIPLQQTDKKVEQQQVQVYEEPIKSGFFKWISIGREWNNLWKSQQSTKLVQFSKFKLVSVPLIIYGYYFYLCNKGAYNVFAFNSEIYSAFYSNLATFAYYLPDISFFISGYLLTKNVFTEVQFAANKPMFLVSKFARKLFRLYPIYIVCLIIFWAVIPSLHSGPVWMVYEEQVNKCDTVWWRNILMIDNFFSEGCFNFSWWVQAEVQYTLLTLGTFAILFMNKSVGSIILYIEVLTSWILLFVLSEKLPVQLQVTVKNSTQHYFKSFHSHLPFYLTGVMLALVFKKQSSKRLVKNYYFKNTIALLFGIGLAIASFLLVLFRPSIFSYDSLNIELALCRTGILYSFIIYCLPGFVKENNKRTVVHKLATLTYPIILVSGIIVAASFWGLEALPYVSGPNLLYNLFPNLFLSIAVGTLLHLLFNFNKNKKQQMRVL